MRGGYTRTNDTPGDFAPKEKSKMHHIIDFILITRNLAETLVSYPIPINQSRKSKCVVLEPEPSPQTRKSTQCKRDKRTLPRALEEEAHHKDLQSSHGHHHQALDYTEIENAALGTAHSAEVAVLASAEVLLVTGDGG